MKLANKSLVGKAMARPDLVRKVIDKAQAEGIMEAWRQAMGRLDTPVPLGYSSAGIVIGVGDSVLDFVVGDKVACSGPGYAGHATITSAPHTLCTKLPDGVNFEAGSFAALGGIALEAIRMAKVSLGETVGVIGLGLLGQLATQLLLSAGCRVVGFDPDQDQVKLAKEWGIDSAETTLAGFTAEIDRLSNGHGADSVIILASTDSNEPLNIAAQIARERARIVASGLVGLEIPRTEFYDKELELIVSRAWGAGLYDPTYTEKGIDYPIAYGRWTAQRNMAAFLDLVAKEKINIDTLISHRYPFSQATQAYEKILSADERLRGVILTYPDVPSSEKPLVHLTHQPKPAGTIGIGLIGAGLFANGTLLPALSSIEGVHLRTICTTTGISGRHTAEKFGFDQATTDLDLMLLDESIDAVFILTRHTSHAHFIQKALSAGKHVFTEKPLATSEAQLTTYHLPLNTSLFVGFNRRYSPLSVWLKDQLTVSPKGIQATINAGHIPADHWVHDPAQGAGRIIGEICHYIDLIQFLTDALVESVTATAITNTHHRPSDNVMTTLKMTDGSIATITYLATGDRKHPRERFEIYGGNRVGILDNFRKASVTTNGRTTTKTSRSGIQWGYKEEVQAFIDSIRMGKPLADFATLQNSAQTTFAIEKAIRDSKHIYL